MLLTPFHPFSWNISPLIFGSFLTDIWTHGHTTEKDESKKKSHLREAVTPSIFRVMLCI